MFWIIGSALNKR